MKKDIVRSLSWQHSMFATFVGFLHAGFNVSLPAASMLYSEIKFSGRVSLLAAQGNEGTWEKQRSIGLKSRYVRLGLTLRIFLESPHQLQEACKRVFPWLCWKSDISHK